MGCHLLLFCIASALDICYGLVCETAIVQVD
jgi:hypothetical protein